MPLTSFKPNYEVVEVLRKGRILKRGTEVSQKARRGFTTGVRFQGKPRSQYGLPGYPRAHPVVKMGVHHKPLHPFCEISVPSL
jgi:hypothetical protein